MEMISVCVIAVFAVVIAAALRKENGETAALLLAAAAVFIAILAVPYARRVIASLTGLSEQAAIGEEYMQALVKSVGISLITRISADICRENGGQSAASGVELCGRLSILLIACPIYAELIGTVASFLK